MIKIEYLFPEITNLYGDLFNMKYFEMCLKENTEDYEIIYTSLTNKPKFLDEDINMIYMGSMSEKSQEIVIERLKPYKEELRKLIDTGVVFLLTGNALEVLGKYIENEDGSKIEGLDLIDTFAKRDMMHRFNTLFLGTFLDENNSEIEVMGHKATFSLSYGNNEKNYLFKSVKGSGINKDSAFEGLRIKNFMGTYLIGPLLVINPEYTKYILRLLEIKNPKISFEKESNICFKQRLEEFKKESTNYLQ